MNKTTVFVVIALAALGAVGVMATMITTATTADAAHGAQEEPCSTHGLVESFSCPPHNDGKGLLCNLGVKNSRECPVLIGPPSE